MNGSTILVPLDGSRFAEFALRPALSMARILAASVEFVSVVSDVDLVAVGDPTVAGIPPSVLAEERSRIEEYLAGVVTRMADVSDVPTSSRILQGDTAFQLETRAEDEAVGLIVMCTHGRGPLSRAWLGSVADQLVRHSPVPVLIIRPVDGAEMVTSDDCGFEKILVPLDGTELAEQGLTWAKKIADRCGSTLELAWIVRPTEPFQSPYLPEVTVDVKATAQAGRTTAERYLQTMADRLVKDGLRANIHVVDGMQAASGILQCADDVGADLIAIATHGRGGLARAALGSVTDKVIRGASIPVLAGRA